MPTWSPPRPSRPKGARHDDEQDVRSIHDFADRDRDPPDSEDGASIQLAAIDGPDGRAVAARSTDGPPPSRDPRPADEAGRAVSEEDPLPPPRPARSSADG